MKLVIVDSNKAWNVTIGCLIINGLMVGFLKIYSLIIIEYQELLDAPMSLLMFGASMLSSLIGLAGPLSTYLSESFTTWKSGIFASILGAISVIIMAFSYDIYTQIIAASLIGISFSIIYIPTFSMPGKCHIKRQNLSQGIVTAGASVGTLIMPLGLSLLINIYSIRGVMLIMSGFILNFAVGAALMPTHIIEVRDGYKPILITIQDRKKRAEGDLIKIGKWEVPVNKFCAKSKLRWPPRKLWRSLILYSIGMANVMNGYMLLSGLYGAFARYLFISVESSAYILIIHSFIDCVARLVIGYIIDLRLISRWLLYCLNAVALCFVSVLVGLFPSLLLFYFYLLFNAIFGAFLMVLNVLILIDVVGIEYISASFSVYIFIQGGTAVIIYYAVGYFCDVTEMYNYAVLISGLILGSGAVFISIDRFMRTLLYKNLFKIINH